MRRYQTDRYGMIASFDIAEALRRAESRRRESRAPCARTRRAAGGTRRLDGPLAGARGRTASLDDLKP